MKAMEGVRKVTNRMEMIQGLRKKLVRARMSSIVLGLVVLFLGIQNYNLKMDLNTAQAENKSHIRLEETLKTNINKLEREVKESKQEIDRLNSFDRKVEIAFELEDILREAIGDIQAINKSIRYYISSSKSVKTDVVTNDYILDEGTGERVKVIEDSNHMFVVYVNNTEANTSLEQQIGKEYNKGTERYADIISSHDNALLVRHDYK